MFTKKIVIYIVLIVLAAGSAGYFVASSKAEHDVAAIRAILEKQEADKERAKREEEEAMAKAKADREEYSREIEEILRQWEAEPKKGY